MASFKPVIRKDKKKPDGTAPLYLRMTHNRRSTMKSLGINVKPKEWNTKKGEVYSTAKNSAHINALITKRIADAQKTAIDMELNDAALSAKAIKNKLNKGGDFIAYFQDYVDNLLNANKHGTQVKANAVLSKLKKYVGQAGLRFEEVTVTWLKDYEMYLRDSLGNSINTIHSNTKIIRKLFNDAVREDLINPNQNPFYKYKLKLEKTSREYLTESQLKELEKINPKEGSPKAVHLDMYIFACYTGGIRISDLLQLRWRDFDGERINYVIQKTGDTVSIKVPSKGLEIINKYKFKNIKSTDLIFPPLKNTDFGDSKAVYKAISSNTAFSNKSLGELAETAKINKNITFHTSRHTWATRALRKGMRIEYVSKLMGHSKIQTTQIYAKIVNEELDNAMDVFE